MMVDTNRYEIGNNLVPNRQYMIDKEQATSRAQTTNSYTHEHILMVLNPNLQKKEMGQISSELETEKG